MTLTPALKIGDLIRIVPNALTGRGFVWARGDAGHGSSPSPGATVPDLPIDFVACVIATLVAPGKTWVRCFASDGHIRWYPSEFIERCVSGVRVE